MSKITRNIIGISSKAFRSNQQLLPSSSTTRPSCICSHHRTSIHSILQHSNNSDDAVQQNQPCRQINAGRKCGKLWKYNSRIFRQRSTSLTKNSRYPIRLYHDGRPGDGTGIGTVDEPVPLQIRSRKSSRIHHGQRLEDEFQWMQEKEYSQDLQDYITQENRYTEEVLNKSSVFQKKLAQEMQLIDNSRLSIDPFCLQCGQYIYWREQKSDGSFLYLRRPVDKDHERWGILDTDDLLRRRKYRTNSIVSAIKVSICHKYALCMVENPDEPEVFNTHVIRIWDNVYKVIASVMKRTVRSEFGSSDIIFYTKPDSEETIRANQVWKHHIRERKKRHQHDLGKLTNDKKDKLLYNEKDERFFVDLYPTRDGRYMCITSSTMQTMTEAHLLDLASADEDPSLQDVTPRLVWPRQDGLEYFVEHHDGMLYVLANSGDGWQVYKVSPDILPSEPNLERDCLFSTKFDRVGGFEVVGDWCVISVVNWDDGVKLVVKSLTDPDMAEQEIKLGSQFCNINHQPSLDYGSPSEGFCFSVSSPIQPPVYYSFQASTASVFKLPGQDGSSNVKEFDCTKIMCSSMDGTQVPITLFHNKKLVLDGSNPLLVCGYGAYGSDAEMEYSTKMIPLLERGWVIAYCHVRGGGELGRRWAESGRQLNKQHTFEDFESCITHLHNLKYSQPKLTAAYGVSAGGLTVAVTCNRAPHLIQAAILKAPFVDVLTNMLDPSLPLTQQDYDEYGDPIDRDVYEAIKAYCPYWNITNQTYPSMYVTTSTTDKRVPPHGPIRYIAKLRKSIQGLAQKQENGKPLIVLKVDDESGHFGSADPDEQLAEVASQWGFLYQAMDLPQR